MNYVQWKGCSDQDQDQKFILKNVLSINRKYKFQEFNIIKVSDFEDLDPKFTATSIQVITSI